MDLNDKIKENQNQNEVNKKISFAGKREIDSDMSDIELQKAVEREYAIRNDNTEQTPVKIRMERLTESENESDYIPPENNNRNEPVQNENDVDMINENNNRNENDKLHQHLTLPLAI